MVKSLEQEILKNKKTKKLSKIADNTQIYIVGGGIASLASAIFCIRDAKIPGENIHIFESMKVLGGALDGKGSQKKGYVVRGARKYNLEGYNCSWDCFSEIPSVENPNLSITEEILDFDRKNKKDAQSRLIDKYKNKVDISSMGINLKNKIKLLKLIFTSENKIENKQIDEWFDSKFFDSNFWHIYSSMFGFEKWHDLVECKRYMRRFMHDFDKMASGRGEVITRYNQYDSMILPIKKWLKKQNVNFNMGCKVIDLDFDSSKNKKTVERIYYTQKNKNKEINLNEDDYVFATIGSMTADSRAGSMTKPPITETRKLDGSWTLWENLAKKDPSFGNPDNFSKKIKETKWITFAVTSEDDKFIKSYEKFTKNKPGQADLITFKDSNWLMSIHVPYQPHFINQKGSKKTVWGGYGLIADKKGNYVDKKMSECNGKELLIETCSQLGFTEELPEIIKTSKCVPSMMPYDTSHFMPREKSDRPLVVPKNSTNLGFMGQFTEIPDECSFTVEMSVRSAQIAVYNLLNIKRKIPKIYKGVYSPLVWAKALYTVFK